MKRAKGGGVAATCRWEIGPAIRTYPLQVDRSVQSFNCCKLPSVSVLHKLLDLRNQRSAQSRVSTAGAVPLPTFSQPAACWTHLWKHSRQDIKTPSAMAQQWEAVTVPSLVVMSLTPTHKRVKKSTGTECRAIARRGEGIISKKNLCVTRSRKGLGSWRKSELRLMCEHLQSHQARGSKTPASANYWQQPWTVVWAKEHSLQCRVDSPQQVMHHACVGSEVVRQGMETQVIPRGTNHPSSEEPLALPPLIPPFPHLRRLRVYSFAADPADGRELMDKIVPPFRGELCCLTG
jgi:hypothetical protein